jgi:hypothetical protein
MRENMTYKFAVTDVELASIDWNDENCVLYTTEYEPDDAAHTFFEEFGDKNIHHNRIYYVKNLDKNEVYKITIKAEKSVVWLTDKIIKLE